MFIAVFIVEGTQVDMIFDELMKRELEGSRAYLLLEIDNHHSALRIVFGIVNILCEMPDFTEKRLIFGVFLQSQRLVKRQKIVG
ncbi:hypothetical protein BpHYR1_025660 [Brachionus plicatilis]|uniref:Uncharacterized protein n=1 Tax=Brachionus plicatilis TaxID=10195 RepID=A0A3M7QUE9_BRAPC|nr:hypothetical protein BpHYR1_025660 [Brachionus plicatilis]